MIEIKQSGEELTTQIFQFLLPVPIPLLRFIYYSQVKLTLLIVAWGGAILISLLRIFWLSAPRWLYVAGYISLGWAAVFYMPAFLNSGGIAIFVLILIGGVLYSAGGVIYALKKPNFSINWFGFHELFHALTAAAFICHFIAAILTVFSNR